ncbi:MAG: 5-formyltetrahydrofolate cyclo-ligase [Moraxellaceae bacterium]|nr:MAG: 5-formyltetrahydrofolate cyclo-ligase [Moraxellaceae bacterium]
MTPEQLKPLRKQLRQQRRKLTARTRQQAGRLVAQHLRRQPVFQQARHIGIYLSAFGEVPTQAIINLCFNHHKQIYLPQICNVDQKLRWVRINRQQWQNRRFSIHKLGMHEPRQRGHRVNRLDLLIMPLLAFDRYGSRVGMGGGYYDRTLWKQHKAYRLGLAYDFQRAERLTRQAWDQPLDAVVTPSTFYQFHTR